MNRLNPEPLNPLISIVVPVYNEARTVADGDRAAARDRSARAARDPRRQRRLDRRHARGARRHRRSGPSCGSSTPRRTAARAAPSASASRRPPAPSSRSRTPTSSSIRRSWRSWCSRSSTAARASSTARGSSRAVPTAPWLSIFGQPGADRRHQRAVRRPAHRHGDLLQGDGAPTSRSRSTSNRTASTSSPRSPPSCCAPATRFSSCRSASSRAAARKARRSAGATACAPSRCCSNTASRK